MAPQAKIAFQDLGSGSTGGIDAPDDLANDYYALSYAQYASFAKPVRSCDLNYHTQLAVNSSA